MIITELSVTHFRIIQEALLQPHPELNLITGDNGSGKSSLLEAIQCLSVGHSFRTRKARELISHEQPSFMVTGVLKNPDNDRVFRAGLEKKRDGSSAVRLNFEELSSLAELTRLLPLKAITPDSHKLIQEGPDYRRQFLDWGVFHVEPQFLAHWRTFRRSLIQRNQLLRDAGSDHEIGIWDELFNDSSTAIDQYRKTYIEKFNRCLTLRLEKLAPTFHVKLSYRSGWNSESELHELLKQNLLYHRKMKTTTDGPHRADLAITSDGHSARQVLSRGQQKVLVYLMHLAQLDVLKSENNSTAIVLCDDLSSEIDPRHTHHLIEQLLALNSQIFISGVDLEQLLKYPHKGFHVKHGVVQNVV